jgi:hypothetical protein
VAGTDIALAKGDRLIALAGWDLHGYGDVPRQFTIGEASIGMPAKPESTATVTPPAGLTMHCGAALSPHSDRIAWLAARETAKGSVVTLWVSKLDGSAWKEIGYVDAARPDTGFGEHLENFLATAPGGLHWLPDGKTLSFRYKGTLYTVPAP